MTTADKSLCEELQKLSGWDDCYMIYWNRPNHRPAWLVEPLWYINQEVGLSKKWVPAYDLGYLLRKLPKALPDGSFLRIEWPSIGSRDFYMGYFDENLNDWKILVNAKKWWGLPDNEPNGQNEEYVKYLSPESLLVKLCIELFKAGVLTAEGAGNE